MQGGMALAAVIEHFIAPGVDVNRIGAPRQLAFLHAARGATSATKQGGGHSSFMEFTQPLALTQARGGGGTTTRSSIGDRPQNSRAFLHHFHRRLNHYHHPIPAICMEPRRRETTFVGAIQPRIPIEQHPGGTNCLAAARERATQGSFPVTSWGVRLMSVTRNGFQVSAISYGSHMQISMPPSR